MSLTVPDLAIVAAYLILVAAIGLWIKGRATRGLASYFLADRGIPWWMLGLSGCSSYIDIGGTMGMVGLLYYVGLKGLWVSHLWWGWFIICFYMAFQAKYIRRSRVMTFSEWNETRFGTGRGVEAARLAAALFLLVLMVCNLVFISVGTGKFAETVLGMERWKAGLILFGVVGIYVTAGGFYGVVLTDMLQTALIAAGAVLLAVLAFQEPAAAGIAAARDPAWSTVTPSWSLWSGYAGESHEAYRHLAALGPCLLAGFFWCTFRVLAGPNVWDFQFFLTARSVRDAAVASGIWTVGYTLRWILGCAFLVLGVAYLGKGAATDAEQIIPQVLAHLPMGVRGLFLAVLLAAFMSTLDAMINVTSSVVVNDLLRRYFLRRMSERALVRCGQIASVVVLVTAFVLSLSITTVVEIWETMIFGVVTMILVPATFRWHWWRLGPWGFVAGMAGSAAVIFAQKVFLPDPEILTKPQALALDTLGCVIVSWAAALLTPPAPMEALVDFYARVRPFGRWGPVRDEAVRQGRVPPRDPGPSFDILNGFLTAGFQFALAAVPFCAFLRLWPQTMAWAALAAVLAGILFFTWYRRLPSRDEGRAADPAAPEVPPAAAPPERAPPERARGQDRKE